MQIRNALKASAYRPRRKAQTHLDESSGQKSCRLEGERLFECCLGLREVAGCEQEAARSRVLPGCSRLGSGGGTGSGIGQAREAQCFGVRLPRAVKDVAGAEQCLGFIEELESCPMSLVRQLRVGLEAHAKVCPDDRQFEQVVAEPLLECGIERRSWRLEQRAARIPECPAMPLEILRRHQRMVDRDFGESEMVNQAMEAVGVLRTVGHVAAAWPDLATIVPLAGEASSIAQGTLRE